MSIFDVPPNARRFSRGSLVGPPQGGPTLEDLLASQAQQQPTQDEIDAALGLSPPVPEPVPNEQFRQGSGGRFLENFGDVYQGPSVQPNTFLSGLLFGAAGGLAGRGKRISQERAKFEAAAGKRAEETKARNLEASRAYQQERGRGRSTLLSSRLAEERDIRKFERERPERQAKDAAAAAAADRATTAAERQNRNADRQTIIGFNSAIRADRDIQKFQDVRDGFSRVVTGARDKSGPGDLALIFGFMKMLDPGSVVREGEFANAENAQGIPDRIRAQYNKVISGERLAEPTRARFLSQARDQYEAALKPYFKKRDLFQRQAASLDVPFEDVFADLEVDPSLLQEAGGRPETGSAKSRSQPSDSQLESDYSRLPGVGGQ